MSDVVSKVSQAATDRAGPPWSVEVVVVNWNSGAHVARLVDELRKQRDVAPLRIVVVDNNSTDGSLDEVRRAAPDVEIIHAGANLGYTGGNNLGFARLGMCDLVLVSNPDIHLSDASTLSRLASALDAAPGFAAVAPLIFGEDGRPQHTDTRLNLRVALIGETVNASRLTVCELVPQPWLDGAIFLARGPALERAGGFDDRYFLFADEVDLGIRLRKAGWGLALVTDARVTHTLNASFGTSRKGSYYLWRNIYLLCRVHAPGKVLWRAAWAARVLKNVLDPAQMRAKRSGPILRGAVDAVRGRFGPGPEDRGA